MDKFNDLIVNLMVLQGYAKDLHYHVSDYSIHLFADRAQDGLDDFIDEIKENCIISKGYRVLKSYEYYDKASRTLLTSEISLNGLKNITLDVLVGLEAIRNVSMGDSDLLGRIGNKLQNNLGILNILLKGKENV